MRKEARSSISAFESHLSIRPRRTRRKSTQMLAGLRANRLTCIHTYIQEHRKLGRKTLSLSYVLSQEPNQGDKHSHNPQERNAPKIATHKILHVCCSALSHRLENLGRGTKDRSCTENSRCLQETKLQTHSTTQSEKTPATLKHSPSLFKKRSPNRDGMPANFDSSLLASEEERKNQRTNERTA